MSIYLSIGQSWSIWVKWHQSVSSGVKRCKTLSSWFIQGHSGSIEVNLGQSGSKVFNQVNCVQSGLSRVDLGVFLVVGVDVDREEGVGQPTYLRFLVTDYSIEDQWRSC